jgi:formylglycine-generating enzyme required for sulfatase activity
MWQLQADNSLRHVKDIHSPDRTRNAATFGRYTFLDGNFLGISSDLTWVSKPHDGRFYVYNRDTGVQIERYNPAPHSAQYFGIRGGRGDGFFVVGESGNPDWNTEAAITVYRYSAEDLSSAQVYRQVITSSGSGSSQILGLSAHGDLIVGSFKRESEQDFRLIAWKAIRDSDGVVTGLQEVGNITESVSEAILNGENSTNGDYIAIAKAADAVNGTTSGQVYLVQVEDDGTLKHKYSLVPPTPEAGMLFGYSTLFVDNLLYVGAPNAEVGQSGTGKVYIYNLSDPSSFDKPVVFSPQNMATGDTFGLHLTESNGRLGIAAGTDVLYLYVLRYRRLPLLWRRSSSVAPPDVKPFDTRPPIAVAPFDTVEAKAHQATWANHLGTTIEITNAIDMTLNLIPAGTFLMGSRENEIDRTDDEHRHKVTISKAFYLQTTEVTQGQWKAVMGTEPWQGERYVKEGPDYPATYVSWDDAIAFCKKFSEQEGKSYRLPTEAEWEYACRAGTKTAWSFGNDEKELGDYAWYDKNAWDIDEKYAHQVGLKKPNAFGLYDMHGNVWEWCHDYYGEDYYKQSPKKDPMGPARGSFRVLRGGSWDYYSRDSRSAFRSWDVADSRSDVLDGFRLVRELDSTETEIATVVTAALAKSDWKKALALDPINSEGLRLKAAAEKAAHLARASITNTIGMSLKLIPAGTFTMGSPEGELDRGGDEYQHKVTISKAFYMQTTEVTQGQWKAVMGTDPRKGEKPVIEGANYPALYVSWDDAVAYCKKLSEKEGKTYRLPTEAEWEYACRAGTTTTWSFGNDEKELGDYAWYRKNAWDIDENYAHQVGLKKANAFGLYDMHGNVWEWCHDYYEEDYYQQSPTNDPQGPPRGSSHVLRGGSWRNHTRVTRSAFRDRGDAGGRYYDLGFRLVRELD